MLHTMHTYCLQLHMTLWQTPSQPCGCCQPTSPPVCLPAAVAVLLFVGGVCLLPAAVVHLAYSWRLNILACSLYALQRDGVEWLGQGVPGGWAAAGLVQCRLQVGRTQNAACVFLPALVSDNALSTRQPCLSAALHAASTAPATIKLGYCVAAAIICECTTLNPQGPL
jgi:hypothetical protein